MKQMSLLRRESFGAVFMSQPGSKMTFLNKEGFFRKKAELLTDGHSDEQEIRLVDVTALGYPLRTDALSSPGAVYIEVTKRCDFACTHCYANSDSMASNDELSFIELEAILKQLAEYGAYYIRLSGGEPTLRADLPDILDVVVQRGMKPSLNTHGRYGERTLQCVLDHGVRDIRISLDGSEKVNDAIRGQGSYRSVLATLQCLAAYNKTAEEPADPTINVVLMKSNLHCVGELIELAGRLDVKISFGLLRPAGRGQISQMLSPEEVVTAAFEVERLRQALSLEKRQVRVNYDIFCPAETPMSTDPFPFDNTTCPIGVLGLGVSAGGRVMPCNYLGSVHDGYWLGEDIRSKDILDIWHHSRVLNEARKVSRLVCRGCRYYAAKCNGGCPTTAYLTGNGLDGRDPYCVREVEIPPNGQTPVRGACRCSS